MNIRAQKQGLLAPICPQPGVTEFLIKRTCHEDGHEDFEDDGEGEVTGGSSGERTVQVNQRHRSHRLRLLSWSKSSQRSN